MNRTGVTGNQTREHLMGSFRYALSKLDPAELVRPHLPQEPPQLIVAVGKAALAMLEGARQKFPGTPWLAVPPAEQAEAPAEVPDSDGEIMPAAHPLPDERSVAAAERVLARVAALSEGDTLLLLLSGGGSSLLTAPAGVTLPEKVAVVNELMRAGASIHQLNAVRKHLSRVKGGRLAAATRASILSLVISDVPGDDLRTVASGPATPSGASYADAVRVLDEFGVSAPVVRCYLERGLRGELEEVPGPDHPRWQRVSSVVIGSNRLLLGAAREYWQTVGYRAVILSDRYEGEAREVAAAHAKIVAALREGAPLSSGEPQLEPVAAAQREAAAALRAVPAGAEPLVLLSGGEATVTVTGDGRGGRNQEFALWLLTLLGERGVWAISAGSDGVDGNSPAAGALLSPDSHERARKLGLDAHAYLQRNDSFAFFQALGDSVTTGLTGNNLNDYRAVVLPG